MEPKQKYPSSSLQIATNILNILYIVALYTEFPINT